MHPTFYFAIGARPQHEDIDVALAVGQTSFLVPGCSAGAQLLARHADQRISVALDSHIRDPQRPSLAAYAAAVAAWYGRPERFAFAVSYDHLGAPGRSVRDHDQLCMYLARLGVATTDDPVVPVVQRGGAISDALGPALADDEDAVPHDEWALPRDRTPAIAVGGMAFSQYGASAMSWMVGQLIALDRRPRLGAHLLGLARPDVLRRTVVTSFDSSRPSKQAAAGWPAIAPRYQARYGFSPAELQAQRAARLAYWIIDCRDRVGLPWSPVRARELTHGLVYRIGMQF